MSTGPVTIDNSKAEVAAGSDPSVGDWRLPLSLRIVAFGFILVGTLAAVDMVMRLVLLHEVSLDFSVLFFLVGWGLYRWRWSARLWAIWLSRLFLALLAIWFPFAVYTMFGGRIAGQHIRERR